MTSFYYQAVCDSDETAVRAFQETRDIFDALPNVTSFARKRFGSALLFRFDDPPEIISQMLELLQSSGLFLQVSEISPEHFGSTLERSMTVTASDPAATPARTKCKILAVSIAVLAGVGALVVFGYHTLKEGYAIRTSAMKPPLPPKS